MALVIVHIFTAEKIVLTFLKAILILLPTDAKKLSDTGKEY